MKKPKFSFEENLKILSKWQEIQTFVLEHPAVGEDNKPLPNPLADNLYLAATQAAKALQQK